MGLIRIVILAAAAMLAYTVYRKLLAGGSRRAPSMKDERLARLVQDPQCQVYVDPQEAVRRKVPDGELFFCSEECADAHMNGGAAQQGS